MTDGGSAADTAARSIWHALAAAGIGVGAAYAAHVGAVMTLLTGVAGLVALLAVVLVTGAALAVVAVAATRRRATAWIGLTALALVPAALVVDVVPRVVGAAGTGGDLGLSPALLPVVVGAVLAGVPALLLHRGRARVLGLVGTAAGTVVVVVTAVVVGGQVHDHGVQRDQAAIARAQVAIGADFRPVTISPRGYGSIYEANIEKRLPGFLQVFTAPASTGHAPGQTSGDDLTVVTLAAATPACGRPLEGVGDAGASEAEMSCTTGETFVRRTSAHGHEVSAVVGDTLVAVSARREVAGSVLAAAVRSAVPIGDQAYRHVLLGDGDEYTDQLDGNRCPVTGVACG